jgi:Ca-activated chloride channel family protein
MEVKSSGLIMAGGKGIPLEGVRIDVRVTGVCSEVTVTQHYHNTEEVDVEAVYIFPMEEGSAICGFSAKIGERVLKGEVEEREKAFELYDEAMAKGHGAFLLEQERPNIFTASVGNLRTGQRAEVAITYVAQLQTEGDAIRLMLPTTISPRYIPDGPPHVVQQDAERLCPETRSEVPYGLTLEIQIEAASPLAAVESPSHPIRLSLEDRRATVRLSTTETALDRDFILLIEHAEPYQPAAYTAREADGTRVAMLTFRPQLEGADPAPSEVLFVLDCSGSMGGDSITCAKRALALCVRALSPHDSFNLIRFGSSYSSLWPESRAFNEQSLAEATHHIEQIEADLGGTDIFAPLQAIFAQKPKAGCLQQILLLTDGEVSNEDQVIELCRQHRDTTRVFSFGIGAGCSEHLVRDIARVSRGAAEFIYPGERIEPKVLRMFARVFTPHFERVSIDWGDLDVEQAPASCPPVFSCDTLTVYGRIKSGSATQIVLRADQQNWEIPIALGHAHLGGPIPTLWARETIRELETERSPSRGSNQRPQSRQQRIERQIVELAKQYQLMSSFTSYIAVEERTPNERTEGQAELRRVPLALTRGWGGHGSVVPQSFRIGTQMPRPGSYVPPPGPPPMGGPPPGMGGPGPGMNLGTGMMGMPSSPPRPPARHLQHCSDCRQTVDQSFGKKLMEGLTETANAVASIFLPRHKELYIDSKADDLFALLMTQNFDGSFPLSEELRVWLADRWDAVLAAAVKEDAEMKEGAEMVATAVVIALLTSEAAAYSDEWKPAIRKAQLWLSNQSKSIDAEALLSRRS